MLPTVSDPQFSPRFDPGARALGQLVERRGRLLVLAAGALVLALVASSVANAGRTSLRCIDGQLVAYRGSLMPAGQEPLDDPTLPPLPVPSALCDDEDLDSLAALRARHREITRSRVDEVMRSDDRMAIESTMEALAAMAEAPEGISEGARERQRQVLHSLVDAKVEEARASQHEAVLWIERARRAGVDESHLRAAERELGVLDAEPESPAALPSEDDTAGGTASVPLEVPAPRSL